MHPGQDLSASAFELGLGQLGHARAATTASRGQRPHAGVGAAMRCSGRALALAAVVCVCVAVHAPASVAPREVRDVDAGPHARGAPDYDAIIAAAHARASANRDAAIRALERYDYTVPATTGSPCCPKPNPAAHAPAASSAWTAVAFAAMGPAIGAMWGNRNATAMAIADEVFANVSINFKYNGFSPTTDGRCSTAVLFPFCSGLGECAGVLSTYCNDTRGDAKACAACVAAAPWAKPAYPTVNPLFPANATCTAAEVASFCGSTAPLPRDTSAARCHACAAALQKRSVSCHILHQPVTRLPLFTCEGCQQSDVDTFCASLGKPPITHDYCWQTRSRDTAHCGFGLPLEQSHAVRGFALFDPTSPRVLARPPTTSDDGRRGPGAGQGTRVVGSWSNRTAGMLREFFWGVLEAHVIRDPNGTQRSNVWAQFASENIDTSTQATVYIALDTLARVPAYANCTLPDGQPLAAHLAAWEAFWYAWLKARATHGLFVELASTGYWKRTWPNMLNLVDLPSSRRVRQRAKMFVDLAMVEAEQSAVAGVRAGQKSRAKDDSVAVNMYPALTPQLYGTNASAGDANNTVLPAATAGAVVEAVAGDYAMANVSVLVHVLGAAPATGGVFVMRNRMLGQVNASQVVECSPSRCADTLRPVPCWCTKGADSGNGSVFAMREVSNQVHTLYRTPSFAMSAVVFSPNDYFSPNTQQRWVGLVFANANHTALSMNHLTGEKWALLDADIGIYHRCGSCNYGGDSVVQLFNVSANAPLPANCSPASARVCQNHSCAHCGCSIHGGPCPPAPAPPGQPRAWKDEGWTFVSVVDNTGDAAYAAVRSAYGGDVLSTQGPTLHALTPRDTWAPIVVLAGRGADYNNSVERFTAAVAACGLRVTPSGPAAHAKDVSLTWRGKAYIFHAQNTTGRYRLPEIDGVPVETDPPLQYDGPHMRGALGDDVVTASYPGYTLEYRFVDGADAIVRTDDRTNGW